MSNGLFCILHCDSQTPFVVVNMLYKVGARNEDPQQTGFAHLLEHLMFDGSKNVHYFDYSIQKAGGTCNAFTTNDITNYYIKIPSRNLETALWAESDRLLEISFDEHKFNIQKQVVIEEYHQRYLNKPYGDIWLLLRSLAYQIHPYRWPTIGSDISHIEKATLNDIKNFYYQHYCPNNAILCIAGNINFDQTIKKVEFWFSEIERSYTFNSQIPNELPQQKQRQLEVKRDVPQNLLMMCFHICERKNLEYYAFEFITDILALGESSRLYKHLVKDKKIFSEIHAYTTNSLDPGLLVIEGYLMPGVKFDVAENSIWNELQNLIMKRVPLNEMEKVKNKYITSYSLQQLNILNKAMHLCFMQAVEDVSLYEKEIEICQSLSASDVQKCAEKIFIPENSSILRYYSSLKNN